jgi:L-alanine-DL-glutamate epimerase-like enolase superfamily enzyme
VKQLKEIYVQVMMLQGPRTYTLVKVLTDAGVFGIGEGYGSPGVGVKEGVLELRPYFIGKDPLDIEALYVGLGQRTDGSAHMLLRAASGIEVALWDILGKALGVPIYNLLGGRCGLTKFHCSSVRSVAYITSSILAVIGKMDGFHTRS